MTATALAGLSGAVTVAAAWETAGALQSTAARRGFGTLARPLRVALAGREPATGERRRLAAVAALTVLAAGYLLAGALFALGVAAAVPLLLGKALRISRERWRSDVAAGAPAAARVIADALGAGYSVTAAIAQAATGGAVPGAAGRELAAVSRALALGADQDASLADLARRAADPSWNAIAAATALQRRAGGDLAGLLRRIAEVADERERVDADARALTAQARFTARLVAVMPLAGLAVATLAVPGGAAEIAASPVSVVLFALAALILISSLVAIGRIARPLR